ncbi:MAG: hypothetical protein ABEH81_07425, partial [Halopenitus sp.]
SEQRDRLSGWGFLGMLSGTASGDNQPNHAESDRLSDWSFRSILISITSADSNPEDRFPTAAFVPAFFRDTEQR